MSLTDNSKTIKLARHIIETKGNISTKWFDNNSFSFEQWLNMSQINSEILVKRAEKLIDKFGLSAKVDQ